ncbi:hypothetical protein [Paraflavitalea sp. CAU 1676]|uniref:hypothetical protein n=1 Tax=Paraflavitalea sp. CAU 1676 TaxID=3032598 RepID=UPI0023D9DEBA|nr:hypothetical protein [Paraflavitalea sp. CAU 1676]MDF2188770.1 hypothetical protein [Paraflavitalea sp. CAU 1676]
MPSPGRTMSAIQSHTVAVVHLIWVPFGPDLFISFIDSYVSHVSGYEHQLVLLFNGLNDERDATPYHEYATLKGVKYISVYKMKGQDLEAYKWVAGQLDTHYILFLNSYSVLLANNWLSLYMNAISKRNVGLIGATASWQSYYEVILRQNRFNWSNAVSPAENFRRYKLLIKSHFYWRWLFPNFPNPHVRSNAFIMQREQFLNLRTKPFKNKFRAYLFESGRHSMTRQVIENGQEVYIIDNLGRQYPLNECKNANIFWSGQQENLLVSDNQTRLYEAAKESEKLSMFRLAWCANDY